MAEERGLRKALGVDGRFKTQGVDVGHAPDAAMTMGVEGMPSHTQLQLGASVRRSCAAGLARLC